MANALFMNGIFNITDPVFMQPLYIWAFVIVIICIGLSWAGWYYRGWKPYAPLHGLYYAMKNFSTVAFIFDGNLVGEMVAERDAKCIFNYADDEYEIEVPDIPVIRPILVWVYTKVFYYPTKYLDIPAAKALIYKLGGVNKDVEIARLLEGGDWERSAAVVCTGVPVDIVIDTNYWTIPTSKQHHAIVRTARQWNEINPADQIHSYKKFQNYLLAGHIKCPEELMVKSIVPWQRIDAAFPLDLDENEWAGKKRQMAADMDQEDSININKLAIFVLIGGLGIAALLLIARLAAYLIH
ncbi:MAG: hypothetical protein PHX61_02270 [Alphaproteobacteria bacterium]|nr:hypothetical protein [Alphaproteobacteria bacterium]